MKAREIHIETFTDVAANGGFVSHIKLPPQCKRVKEIYIRTLLSGTEILYSNKRMFGTVSVAFDKGISPCLQNIPLMGKKSGSELIVSNPNINKAIKVNQKTDAGADIKIVWNTLISTNSAQQLKLKIYFLY